MASKKNHVLRQFILWLCLIAVLAVLAVAAGALKGGDSQLQSQSAPVRSGLVSAMFISAVLLVSAAVVQVGHLL